MATMVSTLQATAAGAAKSRQEVSSSVKLRYAFLLGTVMASLVMLRLLQGAHGQLPLENRLEEGQPLLLPMMGGANDSVSVIKTSVLTPAATSDLHIWEKETSSLPNWLKDYFAFHARQRQRFLEQWKPLMANFASTQQAQGALWNQTDYRFLVVRCFAHDRKCGGLADRLLPLPYLLHIAHNSSRLLLIHFQKPAPLEEYLTPPRGGIDWRIPKWLVPAFPFGPDSRRFKAVGYLEWHANYPQDTVVQSVFQAFHYGAIPYDQRKQPHEPTFRQVTRDVWRVLFTPVLPIQNLIRQHLDAMGLKEGHYASVHIRNLYAIQEHERDPAHTKAWTRNAIHCASQLYPGGPYYVASDSPQATQAALAYGKYLEEDQNNKHNLLSTPLVHTRNHTKTPHHFDRIPTHANDSSKAIDYVPSDYYDTYIDLMLLAMGHCVTHGIGGYGKLASYLSYNHTCSSQHFKKKIKRCHWNNQPAVQDVDTTTDNTLPSLLAPPMDDT